MDAAAPQPRRRTASLPDGEVALLEWGDAAGPVDLVFAHANGFNAETYRDVLAPVAAHGARVWAVDLRGHGRSRLPADPARLRSWELFARDLRALLAGMDGPAPVVAGHSMGATSVLLAAARAPEAARALVLVEPVILPWARAWGVRLPGARGRLLRHMPLAKAAAARRRRWPDRAAVQAAYAGRGAFRTWPAAALDAYLDGGLRPAPDGEGVELCCEPAWEAAAYAAQAHDARGALRSVRAPVRILRAEHGSTCSVAHAPHGGVEIETVAGATHFLPLERPERVREALLHALARPA